MFSKMKKVILIFLLLVSNVVNAGGSHFEVQVTHIVTMGTKFYLSANVLTKFDYDDSGCTTIHIEGNFDSITWERYELLINREIHLRSLQKLHESKENNTTINFGYIGAGLYRVGVCEYQSKGLFYDETGIFSLYTRV